MIEAAGDILSIGGVDGFRHVEDLRLPIVLPPGFGPEQTLISDSEHHKINYQQYSTPFHQYYKYTHSLALRTSPINTPLRTSSLPHQTAINVEPPPRGSDKMGMRAIGKQS